MVIWNKGVINSIRIYNSLLPICSFFEGIIRELGIPFDASKLPRSEVIKDLFGPSYFYWGATNDGIIMVSRFHPGNAISLGNLAMAMIGIGCSISLPAIVSAQKKRNLLRCKYNLMIIGRAARMYKVRYGRYPRLSNPTFFTELYRKKIITNPKIFISPASGRNPGSPRDFMLNRKKITDYEVRTKPIHSYYRNTSSSFFVWTKRGIYPKGRNVLFLDGHVEFIPESEFLKRVRQFK